MPRKDTIHQIVRSALTRDGWTITADPYMVNYGRDDLYIDLAAERLLAAELGDRKIAVECKSFLGPSTITDLHQAVGQYSVYCSVLEVAAPERKLYIALTDAAYDDLNETDIFALVVQRHRIALMVVDPAAEEIVTWID